MDYVFEVAMMSDLISRSWMMEQLDGLGDTRLIKRNFIALVTNAQTVDAVEVVRCRDCKFGDWDSEPDDAMVCMRTKDGFWRSGNDFCSLGKRKDGEWNG